jgi:hypothetical protein
MTHNRLVHAVVAALFPIALPAAAQADARPILVAADTACPYYAADIAGFATCEGDKVVKPQATGEVQSITVQANRPTVTAAGRAAAPWHRARGQVGAAPRR